MHRLSPFARGLLESTPDAVVVVDEDHLILLANAAAERLFGFAGDELAGAPIDKLIPQRLRGIHQGHHRVFFDDPRDRPMGEGRPLFALHKDGREFPVDVSLKAVESSGGLLVAAAVRDVTELRAAQSATAWLAAIVDCTGDAVVGLALDGTIASWNRAAERLYGHSSTEAVGSPVAILAPRDLVEQHRDLLDRVRAGETIEQFETQDQRQDASRAEVSITASPILDSFGNVIGIARVARDVADRIRLEQELKFFADHDPLTGMFNRRRFIEEVSRHLAYTVRYAQRSGALLMADLDNFKVVNDTLGHRAGDDLIITVARLVKARIRATDIVARLGGDEFALLLPRADLREAQWVAESLRASVQAYETVVDGRSLRTTISIGVAEVSAEMTAEDALAAADLAMYEAKHAGRDRVAAAVDADRDPTRAIHHEGWAERLRAALDEDRFCLYRQPIVPLAAPASGSRHELLLRMLDQDGLVPPNAFIYTAERFGLISEIDRWVIANAIRLLAADTDQRAGYHVNVSGLSITTPAFVEFIARELASSGIDPSRLTLEVSETVAIANMETARQFALGLGKAGCQLALDAFGSGFGSFSYLKFLPVQFIKIDAAFITRLDHHEHDRVLVKGIVDVAHGMGIKTIAEHVGTEHTRAMLTDYGADYGQGFHFGQPQLIAPVDAS